MLHLRNINPMVRAVGTMGAVSALVGGITFAQLTSNTVALSSNTLSTGSADLQIAAVTDSGNSNNDGHHHHHYPGGNDNSGGTGGMSGSVTENDTTADNNNDSTNGGNSCDDSTNGTIPGFNLTGSNGLLPGATSDPLGFCLKNASNAPLDLTVAIPSDPFTSSTSGLQPTDVTLHITCDNGGSSTGTLDEYVTSDTSTPMTLGSLDADSSTSCEATVELSNTTEVTGTESLPSFDIEFTGTTTS